MRTRGNAHRKAPPASRGSLLLHASHAWLKLLQPVVMEPSKFLSNQYPFPLSLSSQPLLSLSSLAEMRSHHTA